MNRPSRAFILIAFAFLALVGVSMAEEKKPTDGKALYKEYCKPCHMSGSKHGEYTPMSLIQDQWERFFKDKLVPSHKEVTDPDHENKKVLDIITPELLQKIKKFAIDHAADSEQPMTCG